LNAEQQKKIKQTTKKKIKNEKPKQKKIKA